jgi:signal transduction histidine kinase
MTELEKKYLNALSDINSYTELVDLSIRFIEQKTQAGDFCILRHRLHPEPYEQIYPDKADYAINLIAEELQQMRAEIKDNNEINGQRFNYFLFSSLLTEGSGELFVSQNPIPDDVKSILSLWDRQQIITGKVANAKEKEMNEIQSGLASQLMHDIQAIIDLSADAGKSDRLEKRLAYQKKVNKNYLFWIRECELITSEVPVRELIQSSLQMAGIPDDKININIPDALNPVTVDVELFSMAFNEIVYNAINAAEKDLSKVAIEILQSAPASPFLTRQWTIIKIQDTGTGIKEDFLPFIMNPFFTTRKDRGASGFGLPVAKKIIEAHQGCIELESTSGVGTTVKLIIPG